MSGITSNTAKSSKQLAQNIVRQTLNEPLEILKKAGQQITGNEVQEGLPKQETTPAETPQPPQISPEARAKMEAQGRRQLQALEKELVNIRAQNVQKERIIEEQEQVRKVQTEQNPHPLVEPAPKKGRQLAGMPGPKTQVQRQQTHVERVQPPSA